MRQGSASRASLAHLFSLGSILCELMLQGSESVPGVNFGDKTTKFFLFFFPSSFPKKMGLCFRPNQCSQSCHGPGWPIHWVCAGRYEPGSLSLPTPGPQQLHNYLLYCQPDKIFLRNESKWRTKAIFHYLYSIGWTEFYKRKHKHFFTPRLLLPNNKILLQIMEMENLLK